MVHRFHDPERSFGQQPGNTDNSIAPALYWQAIWTPDPILIATCAQRFFALNDVFFPLFFLRLSLLILLCVQT